MIPIPVPIPRVDTEKKPEHVGEGFLQGLNKLGDHVGDGAKKFWSKTQEGHQKEGALGAAKGVGSGLLSFANGVNKGACDFLGSTLEGVRHTPDAVADKVKKDREHNKHGVEGEGEGEILESYVDDEKEPEHLGEGLLRGAQGLGRGFVGGLKDLANKPMEGAKEGGAMGFAKGVGRGALGFGTKTASGTLDFATSMLAGAKNTPDAMERKVKEVRRTSGYPGASLFGGGSSGSAEGAAPASSSGGYAAAPAAPVGQLFGGAGNKLGEAQNNELVTGAPKEGSQSNAQG